MLDVKTLKIYLDILNIIDIFDNIFAEDSNWFLIVKQLIKSLNLIFNICIVKISRYRWLSFVKIKYNDKINDKK